MLIVMSGKRPARKIRNGRLLPDNNCNSVHEARWLLGPIFILAIVLAAAGLLA